jgi:hypothetical protein
MAQQDKIGIAELKAIDATMYPAYWYTVTPAQQGIPPYANHVQPATKAKPPLIFGCS